MKCFIVCPKSRINKVEILVLGQVVTSVCFKLLCHFNLPIVHHKRKKIRTMTWSWRWYLVQDHCIGLSLKKTKPTKKTVFFKIFFSQLFFLNDYQEKQFTLMRFFFNNLSAERHNLMDILLSHFAFLIFSFNCPENKLF